MAKKPKKYDPKDVVTICTQIIKDNYKEMYLKWSQYSNNGYFSQSDREQ